MNKKMIAIGGIALVVMTIAIVALVLFNLNKQSTNPNQTLPNSNQLAEELKDYTDLSKDEIKNELDTPIKEEDKDQIDIVVLDNAVPDIIEVLPDENEDDMNYQAVDSSGQVYEVTDPFLGMTDEEAEEYLNKLDQAQQAVEEGNSEEAARIVIEADSLIPTVPVEDTIDQSNIDVGFEADIDPNTGEVNYWNPNTVEEPTNPGVVIDYGGQSGQVKADPDKTQSAQDAGYLPGDPNNYIYGN